MTTPMRSRTTLAFALAVALHLALAPLMARALFAPPDTNPNADHASEPTPSPADSPPLQPDAPAPDRADPLDFENQPRPDFKPWLDATSDGHAVARVDLEALDLIAPDQAVAGGTVELRVVGGNRGSVPARGPWLDRVELVAIPGGDAPGMGRAEARDAIDTGALGATVATLAEEPMPRDLPPRRRYRSFPLTVTLPDALSDAAGLTPGWHALVLTVDATEQTADDRRDNNRLAVPIQIVEPDHVTAPRPGDPDSDAPLRAAWISYDDLQELLARESTTEQPAVQRDPARAARPDVLPGSPGPTSIENEAAANAEAQTRKEAQANADVARDAGSSGDRAAEPEEPDTITAARVSNDVMTDAAVETTTDAPASDAVLLPELLDLPTGLPVEAVPGRGVVLQGLPLIAAPHRPRVIVPKRDTQAAQTTGQPPSQPADPAAATTARSANSAHQGRASAAASDRREAPPTVRFNQTLTIRPGSVLTGPGIRINTVAPRPSAVALASTLPDNPTALLTFNPDGKVIAVELIESTGAANWDAPITQALYEWTAEGDKIDRLTTNVQFRFKVLLRPE